jgi:hypothetical protein
LNGLGGDRVIELEAFVRRYYESLEQHVGVHSDPKAPAVFAVMEDHMLDAAYIKATRQPALDVREVARHFWPLSRLNALQALRAQESDSSNSDLNTQISGELDAMLPKIAPALRT